MKVDALGATTFPTSPEVRWQEIAYLHTNWCLHYQEAFLLWHRAYLLYFEAQLGFPVPYWNFMSSDIGTDGNPAAGLPQAYIDETYIDAGGVTKPNPLRYTIAKDGVSAACAPGSSRADAAAARSEGALNERLLTAANVHPVDDDCRYVQRHAVLYTSGQDERAKREAQLDHLVKYQQQVQHALGWDRFSNAEGGGYPWANIPTFPAPDECYTHRCDFDGRDEQPHDNYHGWVGPDMGNNAYAAFDPMFWALPSNIDRVFEGWLRAHPETQFSSNFPLQPFWGPDAQEVELADPRRYLYTSIGDMARDSRRLGYTYTPADDVPPIEPPSKEQTSLHIAFGGVRCNDESFAIDVFVDQPDAGPADARRDNPHYVGRLTRLGMGVEDTNNRCTANGATRVLNADHAVEALALEHGADVAVTTIVTDLTTGRVLTKDEQQPLHGTDADACWG